MRKKNLISFVSIFFLLSGIIFGQNDSIGPKNIILFIGDGMGLSQISTEILSKKKQPYLNPLNILGLQKRILIPV